jgi:hypothetical protein
LQENKKIENISILGEGKNEVEFVEKKEPLITFILVGEAVEK